MSSKSGSFASDLARVAAARESGFAAVERELKSEQACALGAAGRAVEETLAALQQAPAELSEQARAELVDDAAYAVWTYFVQREALGLTHHQGAIDFYRIPGRVLGRVGAAKRP